MTTHIEMNFVSKGFIPTYGREELLPESTTMVILEGDCNSFRSFVFGLRSLLFRFLGWVVPGSVPVRDCRWGRWLRSLCQRVNSVKDLAFGRKKVSRLVSFDGRDGKV